MHKLFVLLAIALAGAPYLTTKTDAGPIAVLEVAAPSREALNTLVDGGFHIDNVKAGIATVYANEADVSRLRSLGYAFSEVRRQPELFEYTPGEKGLGVYHTYATLTTELEGYAAAFPDICRLTSLGQSVQGRELWALLITDNPDVEEDEPEFKYVAAMHGDESLGTEMCLYFIDRLLNGYDADARVASLVDETAIWIVPLMNPDGIEIGWRYNANSVDLNRAFPSYPTDFTATIFDEEDLGTAGREPEVAHVMTWTAANSFVAAANFHTGALVVNYPYDDDQVSSGMDAPTPDDLLFEDVSRRYSQHNAPMWSSAEFTDGITNGAAWYSIQGGMQDWNYRYVSCNEVTIELSDDYRPPEAQLPALWANNEESMLSYLEAVHIGVRGIVTDGLTGAPVWAKVMIAGNAHPVFTDADVGDYHRMLLPGTYTLAVSAPGYEDQVVTGIVVADGTATRLDVVLTPFAASADVNEDGVVNAIDIQTVVNAVLGISSAEGCDVNRDGTVDALDVQLVINVVLDVDIEWATQVYTYNTINSYAHDPDAFTQGLVIQDGVLYEGTGLYGRSSLRRVDLTTGSVLQQHDLAATYFGEGITVFEDRIIQLTWKNKTGFLYNKTTFGQLDTFSYSTEGWGITHDGSRLIMSDGSARLYFWRPDTLAGMGYVDVQDGGSPITNLNELEYINGEVFANVWGSDRVARINPATGDVTGWIDLTGILSTSKGGGSASKQAPDVLNGIAYDAPNDRLYVTGKLWPELYEIELVRGVSSN